MKKIIFILCCITYMITSIIFLKTFKIDEIERVLYSNDEIIVSDWKGEVSQELKLKELDKKAIEKNVNIYKVVYMPKEKNEKQKIVIYSAIGNLEKFKNKFPIKSGRIISKEDEKDKYLSNIKNNDNEQIGLLDIFDRDYIIEVKPITSGINENIRGRYFVESDNFNQFNKIKQDFKIDLKFEINDSTYGDNLKYIPNKINGNIMKILIIIILLNTISFLYLIILMYKELAIKKMFGFTNKRLVFKYLLKENMMMHLFAFITIGLLQLIYLFFYNSLNRVFNFYIEWTSYQLKFMIFSIILSLIPCLFLHNIQIKEMIKNKKPIKTLQIINYFSRIIFSICLLITVINIGFNYKTLMSQNSNQDNWRLTKNYCFYEYKYDYSGYGQKSDEMLYKLGNKSRELFRLNNAKNAILIEPGDGIIAKNIFNNDNNYVKNYDPDRGNVLHVNSNYINKNKILDINNNVLTIPKEYGDYLILLLPNKYRNQEKEILQSYNEWYKFTRYIDEYIHIGKTKPSQQNFPDVKIKIIYIKDNQKHFLYDPELENQNNNCVQDSILVVVNSENMGGDSYLSYMSSRHFYPYVKNNKNAYNELFTDISNTGLQDAILSTPLLYSRIDEYLYNLQNKINVEIFAMIIIFLSETMITIFIVLNYLERNKVINQIKLINGYSFFKKHYKFIFLNSLCLLVIGLGSVLIINRDLNLILKYICLYILVEFNFSSLILRMTEKKKIKEIIKGE